VTSAASAQPTGSSGAVGSTGAARRDAPAYRERLTPSLWVWAATLPVAGSTGLVVLAVVGGGWALLVAAASMLAAAVLMLRGSAVISVEDGVLRADPAHIPVHLLGAVRELDAAQMRLLRGTRSDARAFWCQRGWLPIGVAVEIADPGDPAPYWLLSSRRPGRLAAALRSAKTASGSLAADPPPRGAAGSAGPAGAPAASSGADRAGGAGGAGAQGQAHSRHTS
jgi:hypothetical protein